MPSPSDQNLIKGIKVANDLGDKSENLLRIYSRFICLIQHLCKTEIYFLTWI